MYSPIPHAKEATFLNSWKSRHIFPAQSKSYSLPSNFAHHAFHIIIHESFDCALTPHFHFHTHSPKVILFHPISRTAHHTSLFSKHLTVLTYSFYESSITFHHLLLRAINRLMCFLSALPPLCQKDAILSENLVLSRRVLFSVTGKAFLNL